MKTVMAFDRDLREILLRANLLEYVGAWDEIWTCAMPAPCLPFDEMRKFDHDNDPAIEWIEHAEVQEQ